MDSKRIEELLTKYWACDTSLDEEHELKEFFKQEALPESLQEVAPLFNYFNEQKDRNLDTSFDEKVLRKLERPKGKMVSLVRNSMRIAAGVAVLMAAVWFVRTEIRDTTPQEIVDTYDDPELAFEETKRALMMISKNFSKAQEQAKKIKIFNDAQKQVQGEEATETENEETNEL